MSVEFADSTFRGTDPSLGNNLDRSRPIVHDEMMHRAVCRWEIAWRVVDVATHYFLRRRSSISIIILDYLDDHAHQSNEIMIDAGVVIAGTVCIGRRRRRRRRRSSSEGRDVA